jgi:hypothetical protein
MKHLEVLYDRRRGGDAVADATSRLDTESFGPLSPPPRPGSRRPASVAEMSWRRC